MYQKLLLFLLPMFGGFGLQNLAEPSTSQEINSKSTFRMLYSETYPEQNYVDGFEAIAKIKDALYGMIIKNDLINFYAIKDGKAELLTKIEGNKLQMGSGKAVVGNLIYYEFLVKIDEYRVGEAQYFKLNVDSKIIKKIADKQLVDKNNRYTYDNSENRTYLYQDQLIFVHPSLWYVDCSATIINLKTDQVTVISTHIGMFMNFNNGYLFYDNVLIEENSSVIKSFTSLEKQSETELKITDFDTGEVLKYHNTENLIFGKKYYFQDQIFVSLVDQYHNPYSINQILIENHQIVLKKITNNPYLVRLFSFYKSQTAEQENKKLKHAEFKMYGELKVYDVTTGKTLTYNNPKKLKFGQIYSYQEEVFVSLVDQYHNPYSINRILIANEQIVLSKVANNNDLIRDVYFYNNQIYFYGLSYDHTSNLSVAKLYCLKNEQLVEVLRYQSADLNDSVFSHFHEQYWYLTVKAKTIRINLLTKVIEEDSLNLNFLDILFDVNKIYLGIFEEDSASQNWVAGVGEIEWPEL